MSWRALVQCGHRLCGQEFRGKPQESISIDPISLTYLAAYDAGWMTTELDEVEAAYHGTEPGALVDLCPHHAEDHNQREGDDA